MDRHLAAAPAPRHHGGVDDESEAMQLVLETLFDIRVAVYEVRDYLLEDDDEPEEEEEEDT